MESLSPAADCPGRKKFDARSKSVPPRRHCPPQRIAPVARRTPPAVTDTPPVVIVPRSGVPQSQAVYHYVLCEPGVLSLSPAADGPSRKMHGAQMLGMQAECHCPPQRMAPVARLNAPIERQG